MPLRFLSLLLLLLTCAPARPVVDAPDSPQNVWVEATDRATTTALFGSQPTVEVLLDSLDWSEGPLVLPDGRVLCSDVPRNHIRYWTPDSSGVYLENSGMAPDDYSREPGSNGLALSPSGELLLCQHGGRQLARMNAPLDRPAADYTTLAAHYQGKRFNSPNDLVVAADGSVLFTDPPYGLPSDAVQEVAFQGVYRVDPRGTVTLLTREYSRPNGIGLSPDGSTLYLANSDPKRAVVTATPMGADFTLGEARTLIDATGLTDSLPGLPDGLAVARGGRIFATAPGGVWVIEPNGSLIGKVRSAAPVANIALSPAEDWLYLTNDDRLVRIKLNPQ